MEKMFHYAKAFNQKLNNWNVARVANMEQMFYVATTFNQNLNNWNVGRVATMKEMFRSASAFNQKLCNWGAYYDIEPTTAYTLIFSDSGCDIKTDPTSKTGPWCQSCSRDAIDTTAQTIGQGFPGIYETSGADNTCLSSRNNKQLARSAMYSCDESMSLLIGSETSVGRLRSVANLVNEKGAERMPGECCMDSATNSGFFGYRVSEPSQLRRNP